MRHTLVSAILFSVLGSTVAPAQTVSPDPDVQALLARLDIGAFKKNIADLTQWENRQVGTAGNRAAIDWISAKLESFGYEITRHKFTARSRRSTTTNELENVWATKIGATNPDRMYIISAHMDSVRRAKGANDDASGSSLVIEAARVFASADVHTDASVRFILWNAEETGLNGARAYVSDRRDMQGLEDPPGSGRYPEPRWLGIVQHDQILFDHGVPAEAEQSPEADIDIEYKIGSANGTSRSSVSASTRSKTTRLGPKTSRRPRGRRRTTP